MPQIIVNGRKQDISYKRYAHKDYPDDAQVVRRKNGTAQSYEYNAIVPYEEWMKNADVVIAEDLCGCGNVEEQDQTVIQRLRTPYMAYLRPKAEARKARHAPKRAGRSSTSLLTRLRFIPTTATTRASLTKS